MTDEIVYMNGEFVPKEDAKISPFDRGFLFGDGVYEACPFYRGKAFGMLQHWNRLQNGLKFLKIPYEESMADFLEISTHLLEKNQLQNVDVAFIYLQITRGTPKNRNHAFPSDDERVTPTVFAFCRQVQYPSKEKWNAGFTASLQPDQRWGRVDIKTVNLLPNCLAYQDAKEKGTDDAILVRDGVAMEGAHCNFFVVLEGDKVVTHPCSNQILPGITRAILLEEARANGITVEERPIQVDELSHAKEAFFTSTTTEVKPCVSIDGKPVGDGKVGSMAKKLFALFLARIERDTGVVFRDGVTP